LQPWSGRESVLNPANETLRRERKFGRASDRNCGWDETLYLPDHLSTRALLCWLVNRNSGALGVTPAMVSHPPSADRQVSGRSGSGHSKVDRTPGTPRKDGNPGKEKAVQDPGLKDYVSRLCCEGQGKLLIFWVASRGMFGQGSLWICLQSFQLGYR
jgi:hypothetical protein